MMKKNILLVDYDSESIDTVEDILHHELFDITVAGDETVAKALLSKRKFQLVITELLLPKSHGLLLAQYISENYPETRIIVTSKRLKKLNYKKEALRYGADEFIAKPLPKEIFRKSVTRLLGIREKGDPIDSNIGVSTNVHVLPLLEELREEQEAAGKNKKEDDFNDILENVKHEPPSYEIDLD
jgi:DNA-binding response OmpR family regulator